MFSWQINGGIVKQCLVKVKQEVGKMGSVAEKAYTDLVARSKDIETARYIGEYLHTQSYHMRKQLRVLVGCSPAG
jgi:hypothetical protein